MLKHRALKPDPAIVVERNECLTEWGAAQHREGFGVAGIARNPAFRSISRFNVRREGAFKRELQPTELLHGVAGYGTLCGRY